MKRMHAFVLTLALGIVVGAFLALRHARRTSSTPPILPPAHDSRDLRPIDAWQARIKLETATNYTSDAEATQRLMEKFRREELRQRPQEGRN